MTPPRTDTTPATTLPDLEHLEGIARLMDRAMRIPGTSIRIGLDSIIGLLPGVGDALALVPAGYIIYSAHRMGMPRAGLARMAANTGIDAIIGSIPLIGDIFDVGWKSNSRNVILLKQHLERTTRKGRPEAALRSDDLSDSYPTSSRSEKK
ncbi:MAG: DUF4112 domain-containing protein [Boseongicola sp.]|nr:DUF4112 domain-containing protein [Boseongicola sp.]